MKGNEIGKPKEIAQTTHLETQAPGALSDPLSSAEPPSPWEALGMTWDEYHAMKNKEGLAREARLRELRDSMGE